MDDKLAERLATLRHLLIATVGVLDEALAETAEPAVVSGGVPSCTHPPKQRVVTTGMGEAPSFLCRQCGTVVSDAG